MCGLVLLVTFPPIATTIPQKAALIYMNLHIVGSPFPLCSIYPLS